MTWQHIQQLMEDIDGPAVIVEDGEPRYVVVSVSEWKRRTTASPDIREASMDDEVVYDESVMAPEDLWETSSFEDTGLDIFDPPPYAV